MHVGMSPWVGAMKVAHMRILVVVHCRFGCWLAAADGFLQGVGVGRWRLGMVRRGVWGVCHLCKRTSGALEGCVVGLAEEAPHGACGAC